MHINDNRYWSNSHIKFIGIKYQIFLEIRVGFILTISVPKRYGRNFCLPLIYRFKQSIGLVAADVCLITVMLQSD